MTERFAWRKGKPLKSLDSFSLARKKCNAIVDKHPGYGVTLPPWTGSPFARPSVLIDSAVLRLLHKHRKCNGRLPSTELFNRCDFEAKRNAAMF